MGLASWVVEHVFGVGNWCVVFDGEEIYAMPLSRKVAGDSLLEWGMSRRAAQREARMRNKRGDAAGFRELREQAP